VRGYSIEHTITTMLPQHTSIQDDERVQSLLDILAYHLRGPTPPVVEAGF
jgi:hypothetical protein